MYVWASGNGGTRGDSCSTDGYASSIYTITIGSLDHTGKQPYYEENCPAKIAVAYHHYRGLISNQAHRQTVRNQYLKKCPTFMIRYSNR